MQVLPPASGPPAPPTFHLKNEHDCHRANAGAFVICSAAISSYVVRHGMSRTRYAELDRGKMLRIFGDEIWIADGPAVSVAGFDYPTRMIVIRLRNGDLFIWSPTALASDLRAGVDQLGPVRHIVAPNSLHHKFIRDWQTAYPEAKSYATPQLRGKRPDLKWDEDLGDTPAAEWANDIDQIVVRGNRITTEVVFFHRRSQTAIFTDLIQHFEAGWFKGWRALVAKLDLLTAPKPTVPRKFRATFNDRTIARKAVQRIIDWPTEAVLTAHSMPITHDARAAIAHAFGWLLR